MKKIIAFIMLVGVFVTACETKKEKKPLNGGYRINVKVRNPTAQMLVLNEVKMSGSVPLDTVEMGEDSLYVFEGKLNQGDKKFAVLMIDNQQGITLVLENTEIDIVADGQNVARSYEVKGQKDSEILKTLNDKMLGYQSRMMDLNSRFSAANNEQNKEKMEAIQKEYLEFQKVHTNSLKSFIDSIGINMAAIYTLNFLNWDDEFEYIAKKVEELNKDALLSKNEVVVNFTQRIEDLKKLAVGQMAPDIKLAGLDGKEIALSELRGKYILIDFWASWCGPCRKENPNVVKMYAKYKNKGFEIFGVSLDTDGAKWKEAIAQDQLTWKHVSDLKGWQSVVVGMYQIKGIPFTVLIDKDGKIVDKNLRGEELEQKLSEIL